MIAAMKIKTSNTLAAASDPFLLATDLADYLVRKKVPFRQAHDIMGQLTAYSLKHNKPFAELDLAEYRQVSKAFGKDVYQVLDIDTALKARKGIGAPSPANVSRQLAKWKRKL